ncbi:MAG: TrbC/VirB2 family protein [Candidatus Gracilibacteria bacterium]
MKRFFLLIVSCSILLPTTFHICAAADNGFTGGIAEKTFTISVNTFFPWMSDRAEKSSDRGIMNVGDFIVSLIPMITTMMAVGATLMVIWGGYQMVFGGANPSQTEAGKSIIKDALLGLLMGLLAYVIIFWVGGGKKLIGIKDSTGLPGENANNIISVFQTVITISQDIAAVIAVLGICIVGVMYIMSHGDEEKTASAKKYMVTILIGVLLVFAAWGIMSLINIIPNSFNL